MMEWISMRERLPELYDWVLVSAKDYPEVPAFIATAYRNKTTKDENWYWWWFGYPSEIGKVTHWMPLPKPPEDGENN